LGSEDYWALTIAGAEKSAKIPAVNNPTPADVLLVHVIQCFCTVEGDPMSQHLQQPSPLPDPIPPPGHQIPPGHDPDDPAPVEEPPAEEPVPIPNGPSEPPIRVAGLFFKEGKMR